MGTIDFNKQYIKGEYVVVFVVFLVIALSRLFFPDADLTSTALEIEEKPGGFNARNKVLFGVWPIYSNWMQPMVYVPLANMISYISFSLFGVGLVQFRLPFILFGILGLAIFLFIGKPINLSPSHFFCFMPQILTSFFGIVQRYRKTFSCSLCRCRSISFRRRPNIVGRFSSAHFSGVSTC